MSSASKKHLTVIKGGRAEDQLPTESDLVRDATATAEDLEHEYQTSTPMKFGLPTTWKNSDGSVILDGPRSNIVVPTPREVQSYGEDIPRNVCGHCRYFDLEKGRNEIVRQKFLERVVHDEKWKMKHLGGPVDALGLCGASGGEKATFYVSKACDQFRPK